MNDDVFNSTNGYCPLPSPNQSNQCETGNEVTNNSMPGGVTRDHPTSESMSEERETSSSMANYNISSYNNIASNCVSGTNILSEDMIAYNMSFAFDKMARNDMAGSVMAACNTGDMAACNTSNMVACNTSNTKNMAAGNTSNTRDMAACNTGNTRNMPACNTGNTRDMAACNTRNMAACNPSNTRDMAACNMMGRNMPNSGTTRNNMMNRITASSNKASFGMTNGMVSSGSRDVIDLTNVECSQKKRYLQEQRFKENLLSPESVCTQTTDRYNTRSYCAEEEKQKKIIEEDDYWTEVNEEQLHASSFEDQSRLPPRTDVGGSLKRGYLHAYPGAMDLSTRPCVQPRGNTGRMPGRHHPRPHFDARNTKANTAPYPPDNDAREMQTRVSSKTQREYRADVPRNRLQPLNHSSLEDTGEQWMHASSNPGHHDFNRKQR